MSIELRQLRFAVLTADTHSFSRAADALNTKQATLSRSVQHLEDQLGVRLFERTTRGAIPTAVGRTFLEVARRIVTDVDNLRSTARAVSYGDEGRLAVGFSSSLMAGKLRAALAEYLDRYKQVQFDGVQAGAEALLQGLHARTVDAAIVPTDLCDSSIRKAALWSERIMVVLPRDHPLADSERIYWTDLRREVFVVSSGGIGPALGNLLFARLTDQGYRPSVIVQATSQENIVSMVSTGRFVTLACEAALGVVWPGLAFREVHDPGGQTHLEFSLFWREDNDNPALQRFLRLLEEKHPTAGMILQHPRMSKSGTTSGAP